LFYGNLAKDVIRDKPLLSPTLAVVTTTDSGNSHLIPQSPDSCSHTPIHTAEVAVNYSDISQEGCTQASPNTSQTHPVLGVHFEILVSGPFSVATIVSKRILGEHEIHKDVFIDSSIHLCG
jgi:hypothetical protein